MLKKYVLFIAVSKATVFFLSVKIAFLLVYYFFIEGRFNFGDYVSYRTANYIEIQRISSPAYILSVLSNFISGATYLVDLLAVFIVAHVIRLESERCNEGLVWLTVIAACTPIPLLYTTIYSKEVFVLLSLLLSLYRGRYRYIVYGFAIAFLYWLKAPFIIFFTILVFANNGFLVKTGIRGTVYCILLAGAVLLGRYAETLVIFFDDTYAHFSRGSLTYDWLPSDPFELSVTVLARLLFLDFEIVSPGFYFVAISFYMSVFFVFCIMVKTRNFKSTSSTILIAFAGLLVSAVPYAIFNAGSYSRYVAPLIAALFICSLRWSSRKININPYRSKLKNYSIKVAPPGKDSGV